MPERAAPATGERFARVVHLYPFRPEGLHGGTMRLLSAIAGSEAVSDEVSVYCFDAASLSWNATPLAAVGAPGSTGDVYDPTTLKRRIFPSTLYESGRKPSEAASDLLEQLAPGYGDLVVLHTSYLARLLRPIKARGAKVVVDAHDLVWRAHAIDARSGKRLTSVARALYARTVRPREEGLLRAADVAAVAGYADFCRLREVGANAIWAPTGIGVDLIEPPNTSQIRVGLIGNFGHSATRDSAQRLLRSPLSHGAGNVRLVFAGLDSGSMNDRGSVEVLGPVASVDEFYRQVHCVFVPVASGSGMKCKLAEAALAGRAVITTSAGAEGYAPELARHFMVVDDMDAVTPATLSAALARHDRAGARCAFADAVGAPAAASTYARAFVS